MKKNITMITLMMCLFVTNVFSQLNLNDFYLNKDEYLISDTICELDSITKEELVTKVKNWGGINFVNMGEVLVSETNEQLVFNYITSSFYMKSFGGTNIIDWYIRMIIKVKDNKIKISLYDDGNTYRPGSYGGGVSVPATKARIYKFINYFKKDGSYIKMYNPGLENVKKTCNNTIIDLIQFIKKNETTSTDSDW